MKENGYLYSAKSTTAIDFETAFEAVPGCSALLATNAPVYTILAVTHDYLQPSGKTKETVVGKGLFEAFPPNPTDKNFTGKENLSDSFQTIITTKQPHQLQVQRYDIPNKEGGFTEYYWRASNKPVLDKEGNVMYIIHTAEDITDKIKVEQHEQKIKGLQQAHNLFMQAPMAIHIIKGEDLIIELANEPTLKLWGKTSEVIGKRLEDALPEVKDGGIIQLLHHVRETEQPYDAYEAPVTLIKNGKQEKVFANFSFQPYYEEGAAKASGVLVVATDVTDRVKMIKDLAESEQRFQAAVAAVQGILWTNNAHGEMEGEQPGWAALTGQTFEEYKGYGWSKAVHPHDAQPTIDAWNKAVQQNTTFKFEHRVKVKNKQWRIFSVRAIPLSNKDGSIREWVGVHTDVTEQRLAEQKIKKSEEEFRQLADSLPEMVWTTDSKGAQLFASKRWKEFTGLDPEDSTSFQKMVHPDDFENIMQNWGYILASGKSYNTEVRLQSKDGDYQWFYVNGEPIRNEQGDIEKWVGAYTNINKRKQAEESLRLTSERFRLLADTMPQFVWTGDAQGRLDYFNKSVYDYSGLSVDGVMNGGWIQIVHPADKEENIRQWTEAISTGTDFVYEHRFRRHDGVYRWQLSRAVPQKDAAGIIQMWVGTSTDIHEIKELDEQKDFFIAMVSHELKTPITSIKGYVQLLQQKYSADADAFLINSFKTVNKQTVRITKIISDLLDVSKIKSGSLSLHKELFSLNSVIQEIIDEVKLNHPAYHISFSKEANALVCADKERIGQVVINLLNNAVKYSPDNKTIQVQSKVADKNVVVLVQDFGIGITQSDQKKIFERFYRVEGNSENKFSGFGIGLFIAAQIVQKHEGKITVASEPNKGSVFSFSLPFDKILPA